MGTKHQFFPDQYKVSFLSVQSIFFPDQFIILPNICSLDNILKMKKGTQQQPR